jgi:hypothetical protein
MDNEFRSLEEGPVKSLRKRNFPVRPADAGMKGNLFDPRLDAKEYLDQADDNGLMNVNDSNDDPSTVSRHSNQMLFVPRGTTITETNDQAVSFSHVPSFGLATVPSISSVPLPQVMTGYGVRHDEHACGVPEASKFRHGFASGVALEVADSEIKYPQCFSQMPGATPAKLENNWSEEELKLR